MSRVYEDPEIVPAEASPALSRLSLDIETDPKAAAVYAVGLAFEDPRSGSTVEEVLLNAGGTVAPDSLSPGSARPGAATAVRAFPGEREMLLEARRRIVDLDPDIITGWNVVDFDIRVLARRFAELGPALRHRPHGRGGLLPRPRG